MNKPELKTIYIPELESNEFGIFFTKEEYNNHIKDIIKETLDNAADKADTCEQAVMRGHEVVVDKESITNTFEDTFNKLKYE